MTVWPDETPELKPTLNPVIVGSSAVNAVLAPSIKPHAATSSSEVQSNIVATWRLGKTRVCPAVAGYLSNLEYAREYARGSLSQNGQSVKSSPR